MTLINPATREISFRIVYWGPALSGKTSNLVYIFDKIAPDRRGQLVSLATETERTLFFDFFPVEIGEIQGFKTKFHLYTVPGQDYYKSSRKLILEGVDGLVFVADSQKNRQYDNIMSLRDLDDTLQERGQSLKDIPLLFQYNKRDLEEVLPVAKMEAELNGNRMPHFESIATTGEGVLSTVRTVCITVLDAFQGI